MNRRNFIKDTAALAALCAATPIANASTGILSDAMQEKPTISSFSKIFQFLNYDELAALFKDSGLDGIDLSLRKGGHVEPENVEKDLPKVVKAAQKYGISVPSIVTDILDTDDPLTERVLKTASDNGVKYYRLAYYSYNYKLSIPANLENFRVKMERLGEMNAKYNITGGYQNHYGSRFGSSLWEIWEVIKNMDKTKIGCFYDVHHGVAEGALSWGNAMRLIAPNTTTLYIKDFYPVMTKSNIRIVTCQLGEGIVNFKDFFKLRKELNLDKLPFCLHVEYDLFNEDEKNLSHAEKYKRALFVMKRDTDTLKNMITL